MNAKRLSPEEALVKMTTTYVTLLDEKQAEVDRLKAENAKLRAEQAKPASPPEFKVGDRVRMRCHQFPIDAAVRGEIIYVFDASDDLFAVRWAVPGRLEPVVSFRRADELVPDRDESRFKIGDRVRLEINQPYGEISEHRRKLRGAVVRIVSGPRPFMVHWFDSSDVQGYPASELAHDIESIVIPGES